MKHTVLSILALSASTLASQASVVYLADSAVANPTFQPFSNTILGSFNGDGILSGTTTIADALTYEALPAGAGSHNNGRFEGTPAASDSVTYNFNTPLNLQGLILWNYNEFWNGDLYNDRGVATADITINHSGGAVTLQDVAFTLTPGGTDNMQTTVAQQVGFGADYTGVSSVVFDDITRASGSGQTGWHEVAFSGAIVPEPSSSALLGLGGLALILRRRK